MVFSATLNSNFSVISVLLVKETEVTGENQALLMRETCL
jgi:hypothetical protein